MARTATKTKAAKAAKPVDILAVPEGAKGTGIGRVAPITTKAVKAFNADLQCSPGGTPFQYEIGKTYTIDGPAVICRTGFHACDANPFDVWNFYAPVSGDGKFTRYADVTMTGEVAREADEKGSKIAAASITIDLELSLPAFIQRGVDWLLNSAKSEEATAALKAASGDSSKLAASGDSSTLAASGDSSKLAASGDSSKLAASGDYSNLSVTGKNGVIAASGRNASAKGDLGTWISLAEFDRDGNCIGFATGCIGTDGLETGVSYVAKGGKLVKA